MQIEMTDRLAHVLMDVQDVLTKHGLEIDDLPCGAMWMELVRIAINKVNEDFPLSTPPPIPAPPQSLFMRKFQKVS